MQAILSTAYFPNLQYISKFLLYNKIVIDCNENYSKQSFRNRLQILSANGVQNLTIPVVKNRQCLVKDIMIDYTENWQKNHSRAILSAYNNSPFYEYYIDEIEPFFINREKYLLDLNTKILSKLLDILQISKSYEFSTDFIKHSDCPNFRDSIHPKARMNQIDGSFYAKKYIQVFSERYGFIENLSVIDLIFNQGPLSYSIIKESIIVV